MEKRCGDIRGILTVIGGVLVFTAMGHHGTFGNLSPYLTSYLRHKKIPENLNYPQSAWIYTGALVGSGCFMSFGGMLEKKIGPRLTVLIGGWIMSASVMLTYLTIDESYYLVVLSNGFFVGVGFGLAYTTPIICANKWFPKKKGLVNGIILAGFGVGVFAFNQVMTNYINLNDAVPDIVSDGDRYFGQEEVLDRVPSCFLLLGGIYAGLMLLGALLVSHPPTDEENANLLELEGGKSLSSAIVSWLPRDALRSKRFYKMWITFFLYGFVVTLVNTLYKAFGQTFIKDDRFLALTGGIGYIIFAVGVVFWGHVADRTSVKVAMISSFFLIMAFLLSFIATPYGKEAMFLIWVCGLYFSYSAMSGLMPASTAHVFGTKYAGIIFGLMNTSQATASIICSLIATTLRDMVGWFGMFCIVAGCSFASCTLACIFIPPDL